MTAPRILLVDDSNTSILLDKMILRGYRIDVARSGEECLALATAAPPDLIVLDVMMPGITGYETCRRLRGNEITRRVPVLMCTTMSTPEAIAEAREAGCDDYLVKPIQPDELLSKAKKLLAGVKP